MHGLASDIEVTRNLLFLKGFLVDKTKAQEREMDTETVELQEKESVDEKEACLDKDEDANIVIKDKIEDFGRKSNMPESIFNLVNSIIGGGIIGLSYSFRVAGMPMGLLLLIFCGVITDFSMILLLKCSAISNTYTYQDMVKAAFGKPGLILISIAQFIYPLAVMMAYGVAISDNIPKVFIRTIGPDTILANRQFINGMATLLIMLPLSLPRNIAILDKFSAFSILCVFFYSLVIIIRAGTLAPVMIPSADAWEFARGGGIAQAFGVMAFSYACMHNVFPMYRSLRKTSIKRYSKVVHSSIAVSSLFYISVALAGYITFTNMSQGNLLNNYCPDDDLANVARFVFAFTIILTYPIQVFIAREVIQVGFFKDRPKSLVRHVLITVALVSAATAVSMATDCLGLVIEVAGCFSASPLAFIFPPLCYMKLKNKGFFRRQYIHLWLLLLFGLAVMILGTTMAFVSQAGNCAFTKTQRYWCPSDAIKGISMNKTFFANTTSMPVFSYTNAVINASTASV